MTKNIWLICKYAVPEKYFSGTRHFYLAEEWVKNGNNVTIFTSNSSHQNNELPQFSGRRKLEYINGILTVWINLIKYKKSSSYNRVLSWLQFEWKILSASKKQFPNPEIIIISSLSILSIVSGFLLSRWFKARFIIEIRDIWPLSAIQLGGYKANHPFMWLLGKLERFGYRKADVIVGTMPNLAEHVNEVEPRFKSCICIPQGIKKEHLFRIEPLSLNYTEATFSSKTFKVVYAGTLNINNPIEVLLKAVASFSKEEKVEAYILGSGNMLETYKRKYAFCSRIKFIPAIPKSQVKAFLMQTDLCFDSVDTELGRFGLSRNKWIDYMNAGRPIVCSYSGYKSMINESKCGSFTPFGNDKLLAKEIKMYKKMPKSELNNIGQNGRNYLKKNRLFENLALDYQNIF